MLEPPSGTVTFLFTDIEGSTQLWDAAPDAMRPALERHDALSRSGIDAHHGYVFSTGGDGFCVAFGRVGDALAGAVSVQEALAAEPWPDGAAVRVRMGVHTGEASERDGDYFGSVVNRTARLMAIAHGGQIIVSQITRQLLGERLPEGTRLRDLGEHRLKDLGEPERVFQVDIDGLPDKYPPLRSLESIELPNNLPCYSASFVGRDAELASVRDLVASSRLVTLTGPGGAGKTRLAVHVAADVLDGFGDGVWIVDLAAVTDDTMVPTAIADAIGLQSGATGSIEGLIAALATHRLLIVLDNCEHLIDAVAAAADRLLRGCANVDMLATSREPLGIPGELIYRVPSLGLPDPFESDPDTIARAESVRLFAERVCLHDPDFTVDGTNAASVAAVCRRLDGIPLAVELAAARLRSMSPDELLGRLDQRFRLLTGGSRTAMARQQTLRATIDWSFELLNGRERTALTRSSVFAGGWDLPAAEAIVADRTALDAIDVLDVLTSLVDKSLVSVESRDVTRYRMLETVREYAAEKFAENGVDENALLRQKHLAHYLSLAERAAPRLRTAEQGLWLDRLEADHDNFRAALIAAGEVKEEEAGLRLGIALRWYGLRKRPRDFVEPLAALIDDVERAQTLVVDAQVALAFFEMDFAWGRAGVTIEKALATIRELDDGVRLADALFISAWLGIYTGHPRKAETLGREGLAAAQAANDPDTTARMHGVVAIGLAGRNDLTDARRHFEAELAGYLDMGDRMFECMSRNNRGDMEMEYGNVDAAEETLEPAEAIARELVLPELLACVLLNRGAAADLRGDEATAFARAVEALSLVHRHGITRLTAPVLLRLARSLFGTDPELSARVQGAATTHYAQRDHLWPLETRLRDESEARLRAMLDDETYEACYENGCHLSTREIVALIRAHPAPA